MPRTIKKPEERRQEIIVTALELFAENGYDNTTIQDIANRLGIATGLCYRYFKSKQDIFRATSEYYAQQAIEHLSTSTASSLTAIEELNLIIRSLLEFALKHNEFEASYHKEPEISANRLDQLSMQIVERMIPIINKGCKEQTFVCDDVKNTSIFLTFGIMHMIHLEMPMINAKNYILSYVPLIKELCVNVLKIKDDVELGSEWNNL
ncbi:TetR/AcrR family transcriptional regulator [Blautia producta]|uniref:Nucleoid occlusion factor SlmA n=1 Tax=Blautia producta TaxID=33035 RepID=A0ABZ0U8X5_9FIRM|nr:TetR/AcrR family transcriptional regulator [Blautia coccoides]TCO52673.1 TetR family transcriptional regulator [Blautia coccoides]WPX73675.1 Nucleoid occlusion factor SlmA [Blautia coccoides]SUY07737.1 TetR family transcriptional regulator [Blautia coccoides]